MLMQAVSRAGRCQQHQALLQELDAWLLQAPSPQAVAEQQQQQQGNQPQASPLLLPSQRFTRKQSLKLSMKFPLGRQRAALLNALPVGVPVNPVLPMPSFNAAMLPPANIVAMLGALAKMPRNLAPTGAVPLLASTAALQVWGFSDGELSGCLWALAKLRVPSQPLLIEVAARMDRAAERQALARTRARRAHAVAGGVTYTPVSLGSTGSSSHLLAIGAWAVARLEVSQQHPSFMALATDALLARAAEFKPQDFANVLWAASHTHYGDMEWWQAAGVAVAARVQAAPLTFPPRDLAVVARSCAMMGSVQEPLLTAISAAALQQAGLFNARDVAGLVDAFAVAGWACGVPVAEALVSSLLARTSAGQLPASAARSIASGLNALGCSAPDAVKQVA